nr:DUF2071 domain-containing protein [Halogeometricum pallidum]
MGLRDVLFAHWPVDPEEVSGRLPSALDAVTFDGRAWISVVALRLSDARPRGAPFGLTFPQVNVRTYVERAGGGDGEDGGDGGGDEGETRAVYFFALDADDRVGVPLARGLYSLPYYRADVRLRREGDGAFAFASRRTHRDAPAAQFDATYRPVGEAFEAKSGTRASFLTENYRFYAEGRTLIYGDIDHDPWPLYEAEADVRTNTLVPACGLDAPSTDPVFHYSPGVAATAGRVHLVRG